MKNNSKPMYDVAGIGNAIVDVLSFCDDAFIAKHGFTKGAMTLIDAEKAAALYRAIGPSQECSGGSVANTLAGMASLGARGAFIGKVSGDQLGSIFIHDMHAVGVHFTTPTATSDIATAVCMVLVTPDAQRTMGTYIGACSQVSEHDIDEAVIRDAAVTYIEGYLWDAEQAKTAIRKAIYLAKTHGRKVALTLSDTFCVDRHRDEFLDLITHDVDILFANEAELKSLYQTDDFDAALARLSGACEVAAVTRSEKGSVVIFGDRIETVPGLPVPQVTDTTGAGDLYAAGFLFGYTRGWDMRSSAKLGNSCAAEIIQQLGARSLRPLRELVA